MKVDINGQEYYFDGYLLQNLEIYKQAVAKKWDGILYVGGYEGDGKSEWAGQVAYYLDPTYNLSRCVFTAKQFSDAVRNAKPGQAIVYDEAQDVFESTARDKRARDIKSMLTRIRRNNLYIIIVAPDFWRINKYLFIHRARAFIRVYADGLNRGYFEFYNREKKHKLMIEGRRTETLCVAPNFRGRFTHWFPLDEKEYDDKKEAAEKESYSEKEKPRFSKKQLLGLAVRSIHKYLKANKVKIAGKIVSLDILCGLVGINPTTAFEAKKKAEKSQEIGVCEAGVNTSNLSTPGVK